MKTKAEESNCCHGGSWVRGPLIGKGSFGSVFLATSKKPRSRFACFPSSMAVKSAEVSVSCSLQKEKEVLDNVRGCPYIIGCFGEETTTQENGEMVYNLLLEYASGGTLADSIEKSDGFWLPESDVKRYTRSILKGLIHIHDCGYVHCDIKPENVLLVPNATSGGGDFVAKIGDLGLAKRSSAQRKKKRKLDLNLYLRGTPLYISPETVMESVQEPPSDIWALGCVVCKMLTGKSPWDGAEEMNTEDLLRLIGDEHELPKIPTGISEEARDFLKACLVRKPMYRFTAEMLMDHQFLAGVGYHDPEVKDEALLAVRDEKLVSTPTDSELTDSSVSGDWLLLSDDSSYCSSWPEEDEDLEVQCHGRSDKNESFASSLNCLASTVPIGALAMAEQIVV